MAEYKTWLVDGHTNAPKDFGVKPAPTPQPDGDVVHRMCMAYLDAGEEDVQTIGELGMTAALAASGYHSDAEIACACRAAYHEACLSNLRQWEPEDYAAFVLARLTAGAQKQEPK
jgi:hypothetical protein